jgi:hypothetical protein
MSYLMPETSQRFSQITFLHSLCRQRHILAAKYGGAGIDLAFELPCYKRIMPLASFTAAIPICRGDPCGRPTRASQILYTGMVMPHKNSEPILVG